MTMTWEDVSEIVAGLILQGRLSVNSVNNDFFFPPYGDIIKLVKENQEAEDIISTVGLSPYQAALDAAKSVNGLAGKNWCKILEDTAISYDYGKKLEKIGKKMQYGETVDWSQVHDISTRAQQGTGGDFVPLSEIQASEIPFKKTGMKSIDIHLGGLPEVGQIIIGASPGVGKTSLMATIASCWVQTYPEDRVAIFTLEMMASELARRFREVHKLTKEQESRIMVNDSVDVTPETVISKSATIENLGLVEVDFADLLIEGETTESAMAHIYRVFMLGAKRLHIPLALITQLNRQYQGGIPRPFHIRYTGLAEALAGMLLMLYDPTRAYFSAGKIEEDNALPLDDDKAYIIAWKIRGGFRRHLDESPGAIQIDYTGKKGWNPYDKGIWFSLRNL